MSSLGAMFLKIANYLSFVVNQYIVEELDRMMGSVLAKVWAPRLAVYDLLNHQISTKPGGVYDWHHDCKWMLVDHLLEDWDNFFLCVPTFCCNQRT